jgi:hypothetical protein
MFKKIINTFKNKNTILLTIGIILFLIGMYFIPFITIALTIGILLWIRFDKDEAMSKGIKRKCPQCKSEIEWDALVCPQCRKKTNIWTARKKKTALILSIFIFIIFSGMFNNKNSSTAPTQEQAAYDRKIMSTVFAEENIENILKSPSTAKFVDVRAYELSNQKDVWAVNGYVDSQNSFGAMIRSQWEVQLDYRNGKGGIVKSILFDGKEY